MHKRLLITGVTGNLGKAVAAAFARQGYEVTGLARSVSEEVFSLHAPHKLVSVDLADQAEAEKGMAHLLSHAQSFDVAVLTAGGFRAGTLADTTITELREQIRLNAETAFVVAKPLFQRMLEKGEGRLFFIGSAAGHDAAKGTGSVAYALSKSLLFHLAALLNAMAGSQSVRAYVVVPGIIDTPQNRAAMPDADRKAWLTPDDIAARLVEVCKNPISGKEPEIIEW